MAIPNVFRRGPRERQEGGRLGIEVPPLGLDALTSEEDLLRFEAMLEEQGRITYSPEQRPAFLDDDGPPVMFD